MTSYQVLFRGDVESAASVALDVFSFVLQTAEGDLDPDIQEE